MPKVSVVVPVYNKEKYLKRCVDSLVNQTLTDIEIILVDDGSKDNCPAICDELAKNDNRIKVIHNSNGGASSARNAGIISSLGEYIGFADADDCVEADAYEKMYNCAVKNNVDFVMADYHKICDDNEYEITAPIRSGYYAKQDIKNEIYPTLIMRDCVDFGPLLSVCHCLYKSSFIKDNNLLFDEEILWAEDCIYSIILGYMANSFYYLKNEFVYNYIQTQNSTTTTYNPKSWVNYCLMNDKLREFFKNKKDYDFSNQLYIHIIYFACSTLSQLKYTNLNIRQKYDIRKGIIRSDILQEAIKNAKLSVGFKQRVIFYLMKHKQSMILTLLKG